METRLRLATPADAPAIRDVYAPYVRETAVSFELEVPSAAEMAARIGATLERYPYLVAEAPDGALLGYAYLGRFVGRAAYDHAAETSIYLAPKVRRQGLGRRLYSALERVAIAQGICNLEACIGVPPLVEGIRVDDERLTWDSVRFHERLGFRWVGSFDACGFKFGRWWDMAWMEKVIAPHKASPQAFVPAGSLDVAALIGQ